MSKRQHSTLIVNTLIIDRKLRTEISSALANHRQRLKLIKQGNSTHDPRSTALENLLHSLLVVSPCLAGN